MSSYTYVIGGPIDTHNFVWDTGSLRWVVETQPGGGSGGTSSTFGAPFPASGTAVGFKDSTGALMAPGNLDAAGFLKVNVAAGGAGGGAVTVADGADVAEGATADAAVTGDNAGTLSAKIRGLAKILFNVWDSGNTSIRAVISGGTLAVSQAVSPFNENVSQFGGVNVKTGIGPSATGVPRVTVAYDGSAIALQNAVVSAIVNGTTTRTTTIGLGQFTDLGVIINITGGGGATGNFQIFIQDTFDGGVTWDDVISSPVFAFGATATTMVFVLSGKVATSHPQGQAAQQETLAAGQIRYGTWGDQLRVREKISGIAGGPIGVTYSITATGKI